MKNARKLFTITCIFTIILMLSSCATTLKNPRPLRAAAVSSSTSDSTSGLMTACSTGTDDDIAMMNQMLFYTSTTDENYHPDGVSMTIDGTEYTLQFKYVQTSRSDIDWLEDVYKLNQGDLHIAVTYAHGDNKHPIGYSFFSTETYLMYNDPASGIVHLSEDKLVEKAREYAAPYVDLDVYNDYVIDYSDQSIAGGIYSGWYDIKFCTKISGIECVDYTIVRLYPDGRFWSVSAPPQTTISEMFSKINVIAGCDTLADQSANDIRTNIEQAWSTKNENGYRFSEQKCIWQSLTLDGDGNPVVIYYYKLNYTTDKTREVNGEQFKLGDVTQFVNVGVWLG